MRICSIMIYVSSVQSLFVELSLTNNVTALNFLRCGLGTKKPDAISNRQLTTV